VLDQLVAERSLGVGGEVAELRQPVDHVGSEVKGAPVGQPVDYLGMVWWVKMTGLSVVKRSSKSR
jgi:hypothetical protein